MSEESLHQLEREVEAARAKLASDLSILRSPATSAEFTATLKQEAKSSFQSTIEAVIEDIRARAAANPAAALAIGAGVAWRIIRHPPIATALVGAGLISLFRTAPAKTNGQGDYFSHAKARLREQALQVADIAGEQTAAVSGSITQKTGELAAAAKERIQEWTAEAGSFTKRAATDLGERAASISDQLREGSSFSPSAVSEVVAATGDLSRPAQQAINDPETRDKLLLGTAGVAIVAALSIALQRRFSEGDRPV